MLQIYSGWKSGKYYWTIYFGYIKENVSRPNFWEIKLEKKNLQRFKNLVTISSGNYY